MSSGDVESSAPLGPVQQDDADIVAALRRGDEAAFDWLVEQHHATLVRIALRYVPNPATAEDVAQDTWLHVLKGLARFELRSSLKTWIFSILVNRARSRHRRDRRTIPFTDAWTTLIAQGEPSVNPERFFGPDHPALEDRWVSAPRPWEPEDALMSSETQAVIQRAIANLPLAQREVITLRDIDGWSSIDVCTALGLTETNQRVLLHRARSRVRGSLEQYLGTRR